MRPVGSYSDATLREPESRAFKLALKAAAADYGMELRTLPQHYPFPAGRPVQFSATWLWNHLSIKRRITRTDARRLFVMLIRHPAHRKANPSLNYVSYLTPRPDDIHPSSVHERSILKWFPWILRLAPEEMPRGEPEPWDKPQALISPLACDRLAELIADKLAAQTLPRNRAERQQCIRKIIRLSLRSSAPPMANALYMSLQRDVEFEKMFGRTHKYEGKLDVIADKAELWWTKAPREKARKRRAAVRH